MGESQLATATRDKNITWRGIGAAVVPTMPRSPETLNELARRVEAEHRAMARACDQRWHEELERRRREISMECSRLLHHG